MNKFLYMPMVLGLILGSGAFAVADDNNYKDLITQKNEKASRLFSEMSSIQDVVQAHQSIKRRIEELQHYNAFVARYTFFICPERLDWIKKCQENQDRYGNQAEHKRQLHEVRQRQANQYMQEFNRCFDLLDTFLQRLEGVEPDKKEKIKNIFHAQSEAIKAASGVDLFLERLKR